MVHIRPYVSDGKQLLTFNDFSFHSIAFYPLTFHSTLKMSHFTKADFFVNNNVSLKLFLPI